MIELNRLQKAQLVWELCTDIYNRPMRTAVVIIVGREAANEISNLEYKYQDILPKTLSEFISIFNEDLSGIDKSLLS